MKGIVIIAFDDESKLSIDTQFPSNLSEFLKLEKALPETANLKNPSSKKRPFK